MTHLAFTAPHPPARRTRSSGTSPARARARPARLTVRTATSGLLEIVAVPVEPTQATVQVQGELDAENAEMLSAALAEQLAQGHRFVRLDLSRLTFLDCTGLGVIVAAHNEFLYASGTLVLTGIGERVARLLSLTHLDEALLIADGPGEPPRVRHLTSVPDTPSEANIPGETSTGGAGERAR